MGLLFLHSSSALVTPSADRRRDARAEMLFTTVDSFKYFHALFARRCTILDACLLTAVKTEQKLLLERHRSNQFGRSARAMSILNMRQNGPPAAERVGYLDRPEAPMDDDGSPFTLQQVVASCRPPSTLLVSLVSCMHLLIDSANIPAVTNRVVLPLPPARRRQRG